MTRDDGTPSETMACWDGNERRDLDVAARERVLQRLLAMTRALERDKRRERACCVLHIASLVLGVWFVLRLLIWLF